MDVLDAQNQIEASDPSDFALELLSKEQTASTIETMETTIARLRRVVDRLKDRITKSAA